MYLPSHYEEANDEELLRTIASICYRIAVGPIAGRKILRLHTPGPALEGPGR